MTRSAIPVLLPIIPFVGAVVAAVVGWASARAAKIVAIATAAAVTAVAVVGLARVLDEGNLTHPVGGWAAPLGIEYVLDPLSAFIAVLIGSIGTLVVLYPTRVGFGVDADRGVPLHALVLLLLGALFGVAVAGDLFNLFVSLEIYSIASYALIALGGPAAAVASYRYLLIGTVGSSLYLLGVGFVYFTTGTLGMEQVTVALGGLTGSPTTAAATALIVIGLGTKMAVFPLHVWLPDAHSHAPPAVAALLASVQVKVAAYALVRVLLDVFPPRYVVDDLPVLTLLTWFGVAGVVVGSVSAIRQDDVKRMLAHSTVAQIGYIAVGIGLASPLALVGALLHVVNHAVMKACLFFVAGAVLEQAGTKSIAGYAGLGRKMPWTMTGFTVAAISMVGLPPTAGFFSKWYLVSGAVDVGSWVVAVVIVASSVLTLVYFLRVLELVWFRAPADADAGADADDGADTPPVTEAGPSIVVPIGVLAAAVVVLGLVNLVIVEQVLDPVAARLLP
jgi:multicomponent Na+:H+ antiporter subunit D